MDMSAPNNKSFIQPKTMLELLPCLSGIIEKDGMQTLTAKKQTKTVLQTRTSEKITKPLTIAEMRADILSLKVPSPRRFAQELNSNKKKAWCSSIKVDKKISHTANGLKNTCVRKVLNFQSKPKVPSNPSARYTMMNSETPKFPKPMRPKHALNNPASNVRISGVYNISETPSMSRPTKSRITLANKENINSYANYRKSVIPKSIPKIPAVRVIPDTPLSNDSWKSSCDNSFVQNEKDINDLEINKNGLENDRTLENIADITPPASTPFTEYRSIQKLFDNSQKDDSEVFDNTVMCFDKTTVNGDSNKREESVIVSLCELLSKASVTQSTTNSKTELEELQQLEKQTEEHLRNIDTVIEMLKLMKESELKTLFSVKHLIQEKINPQKNYELNKTLTEVKSDEKLLEDNATTIDKSPIISKPISVIKSCIKSPSYKIPKKNSPLRKKVLYKSIPNITNENLTPPNDNKALNVYMKMKEQMNFLNTPLVKPRQTETPDTPAVTSHNLQMQLDKLYMAS